MFERRRLSIEQAVQEARHLAGSGHRTIDLVTGEIATDRFRRLRLRGDAGDPRSHRHSPHQPEPGSAVDVSNSGA